MTISATIARQTNYSLAYLLAHDGAAGDTLTLSNATLVADATVDPIKRLLSTTVISVVEARTILGGFNPVAPIQHNTLDLWIEVRLTPLTSIAPIASASLWTVVASDDGAFNIVLSIQREGQGDALVELTVRHTLDR